MHGYNCRDCLCLTPWIIMRVHHMLDWGTAETATAERTLPSSEDPSSYSTLFMSFRCGILQEQFQAALVSQAELHMDLYCFLKVGLSPGSNAQRSMQMNWGTLPISRKLLISCCRNEKIIEPTGFSKMTSVSRAQANTNKKNEMRAMKLDFWTLAFLTSPAKLSWPCKFACWPYA